MEQHCISNKDINIARDNMKCHAISGLSELAKNSRSSTFLVHKLYLHLPHRVEVQNFSSL